MHTAVQTLRMPTPVGELELVAEGTVLVAIHMEERGEDDGRAASGRRIRHAADRPADRVADGTSLETLTTARRQLEDYFSGRSDSFALPTRRTGTEFQLAVWDALRKVGYGETITYAGLAARIGRPSAARAVGQALARNRLPIVVPCHRVVGSLGELTGFGGGIDRKGLLLELEKGSRAYASSPAGLRPTV
jgi:methylated-DNA-[protein]-cysteine S-methyltransferase